MKPFDLEAAKRGEPIVTRAGQPAHFIAYVPEVQAPHQLITRVEDRILHNHVDGTYYANGDESGNDLFMAPRKRTVWVNLYPGSGRLAYYYDSQEEAGEKARLPERLGGRAWPLEIEE